jgi:proteasome lid subunit RPN8/RPN11
MAAMADTTEYIDGLARVSELTIYRHVFDNADREVGGVLIGRAPADAALPQVTAAIPAIAADEQRATLTFTQEAWEHVHRVLDREHPDKQIVGWYHSHPGFGIFLSDHDLFIHQNFFSGPAQIALVVDPLAGTEGVFCWHAGSISQLYERPTAGRWIGLGSPRATTPVKQRIEIDVAPEQRPYPIVPVVLSVVVGLGVGLLGARVVFNDDSSAQVAPTPAATASPIRPTPTPTPTPSPPPAPTVTPSATATAGQPPGGQPVQPDEVTVTGAQGGQ